MIPKILHQIWIGPPMPAQLQAYTETWKHWHPGWEYQLWDEHGIAELNLRNQNEYDRASQITPGFEGQLRSDLARYEILHTYGGVYVDADFECLRSIDTLIADLKAFAAWEVDGVWVNNAILGCIPGHPMFERIIDRIPDRIESRPGQRPNRLTGPHLLTTVYRQGKSGLHVFPKALFYPYLHNELHRQGESFPNAYAVHHWNNARRAVAA